MEQLAPSNSVGGKATWCGRFRKLASNSSKRWHRKRHQFHFREVKTYVHTQTCTCSPQHYLYQLKGRSHQVPFNYWKDTQNVVDPHNKTSFGQKKNEILIHATTEVNLEYIMLSGRSESLKMTYYPVSKIRNAQNGHGHRDRKCISGCLRLERIERMGRWCLRYFWCWWKCSIIDCDDGCTTQQLY